MGNLICHIRTVYNAPGSDGGRSQPGKIRCRVAAGGELGGEGRERGVMRWSGSELDGNGAPHLPAPLDVFRTLDVALDGFGTDIPGGAHIVRRGPKAASPKLLAQRGKTGEQLARRRALDNLHRIRHRDGRRNTEKQVDVVWLNLLGDHRPPPFLADHIQQAIQRLCHLSCQQGFTILREPYQMVCRLIDAVPVVNYLHHVPHGSKTGLLGKSCAIPLPTEVGSFLAEAL